MKIRIQDHSIRFRLTLREVEQLGREGKLERETRIVSPTGPVGVFRYGIDARGERLESDVLLEDRGITLLLAREDLKTLLNPTEEGIYIRREWQSPEGEVCRFMAFAEKDRPGSTCVKPEAWIYDAVPGKPVETRPIPSASASGQS